MPSKIILRYNWPDTQIVNFVWPHLLSLLLKNWVHTFDLNFPLFKVKKKKLNVDYLSIN